MMKNKTSNLVSYNFGDLFNIKHGYGFKGEYFANSGSHILLTPGNFYDDGGFKFKGDDKEKYYVGEIPDGFVLKEGDLIVAMTEQMDGLLGSSAIVPASNKYLHNQRLGLIVDLKKDLLDKNFLYYLFNTRGVRNQIKASASGTKVRHTSPARIYEVKVNLPPLPVQRKIADVLSAYDDLIEANTRRIRILEQMAQSVYCEWFGKVDGKSQLVGWEIKTVGDYGDVITGKTPSKAVEDYWNSRDIPFIRTPDMHDQFYCIETTDHVSTEGANSQKNAYIPPNSLCVSCIGTVGIVTITSVKAQTNQQINSVVLNDLSDLEFLYFELLGLKETLQNFAATGATMANLSKGKFMALNVLCPPKELREKFHAVTSPMFEQIKNLQYKNANLRRTRDLLLPRLVSGELELDNE